MAEDERFQRDGTDLISVVSIPATEAMLGTAVTVPTLDGESEIEVAAGAPSPATKRCCAGPACRGSAVAAAATSG